MDGRLEYRFVRVGEGWLCAKPPDKTNYQQIVHDHAAKGWRLVQIFTPVIAGFGAAKFYELIFEREVESAR